MTQKVRFKKKKTMVLLINLLKLMFKANKYELFKLN